MMIDLKKKNSDAMIYLRTKDDSLIFINANNIRNINLRFEVKSVYRFVVQRETFQMLPSRKADEANIT